MRLNNRIDTTPPWYWRYGIITAHTMGEYLNIKSNKKATEHTYMDLTEYGTVLALVQLNWDGTEQAWLSI